jgi:two-component system cell cycle sensor histidine kinase/response regulator CckA
MHLLRRLIGENIQLDVIHGRNLWEVKVDQGQLEQVIINLAVNARDAMAEGGGELAIRTSNQQVDRPIKREGESVPPGAYVLIEVADSGCGIAQENLDRIFEPFFSTKEVGAGTGLGLSTVYGIVKQTGGFILVDSAVGVGTNFQIYLPRHSQESAEGAGAKAPQAQVKDLTGAGTLLLVEDEDAVRAFSARALRKKGYDVLEASSGEAALEVMAESGQSVDLLITDVVMPNVDGPTLVKRVRETHPNVKVIFISGYTEDSFRRNLGEESDIHFLGKPFTLKQLAGVVKDVLYADAS